MFQRADMGSCGFSILVSGKADRFQPQFAENETLHLGGHHAW
jgi:hypothetical protein